jgi:hypothetical protein
MFDQLNVARFIVSVNFYDEAFEMIRQLCRSWDSSLFYFSPFVTAARQILENNPVHTDALNMIVICDEDQDQNTEMKMALR